VPQDEIVHRALSVREALEYAARLRLPSDTERRDRTATIDRVMAELSLGDRASTRVGALSGGQRKRVGVATELLRRPSLLFLDEPTTGLDPALESQLMEGFRTLAEPGVRSVVLVTHATRNLALCDRIAVVARRGELAFVGAPTDALAFFGVASYDDIYTALDGRPAAEWRRRHQHEDGTAPEGPADGTAAPEPGPAGSPRAKRTSGSQVGTLVHRYARLFVRDPRNLAILLGQVPIIALAIGFLFQAGVFERAGAGARDPTAGVQLLFLLVTTVVWFGSIDASREIVKERSVAVREAAVGVRLSSYLASKVIVLFVVAALQTLALTYFVLAVRPLDEPVSVYLQVSALLVLTSFVGVGIGLAVSAAVRTEDQATSFIPLTLIPQLLFAGAIVPVAEMTEPIAAISAAAPARWALAGVGGLLEMGDRIAANPAVAEASGYGDFFELAGGPAAGVLGAFLLGALVLSAALVGRRRER
jgi:energy-coupling factor transporter ATP-binding protein EcfA2/ABC-type multidrug transport system permease subunit